MDAVIVPTYNESENIGELLHRLKTVYDCLVLVIDDSNDKNATATAAYEAGAYVVQRDLGMTKVYPGAKVTDAVSSSERRNGRGLSSAVAYGLEVLNDDVDRTVVMDADLQHPPEVVPKLFEALDSHDFVVASRYIDGGGCKEWDFDRKVISRFANLLARPLVPKVHDLVSGFFGLKREGLPDLSAVNDRGFKIMLELLVRGHWKSVVEVPFIFQPRLHGETKMRREQMRDYTLQLASLYVAKVKDLRRRQ